MATNRTRCREPSWTRARAAARARGAARPAPAPGGPGEPRVVDVAAAESPEGSPRPSEGRRGSTWAASFVSACAAAALVLVGDPPGRADAAGGGRRSSSPRPSTITSASSPARIRSTSRAAASTRSSRGSRAGSTSRRASRSRATTTSRWSAAASATSATARRRCSCSSGACTRSRCWCFRPTGCPGRATICRASAGCRSRAGRARLLGPACGATAGLGYALVSDVNVPRPGGAGRQVNSEIDGELCGRDERGTDSAPPPFNGQEVTHVIDRDRRDILKLMARGRRGLRVRPGGRRAQRSRRNPTRGDGSTSSSCSSPTRTGDIAACRTPKPTSRCQKAIATINALAAAAGLHRLHRRPHAHDRRRRRAPQAHDASSRSIVGRPEGEGRALHARRARRVARPRRARSRSSSAPRTTPSTTRACTSSRSTTSPTPRRASATSSSPGSRADLKQARPGRRIVVFTHRPLFDLSPQWDWATRDGAKVDRRC